MCQKKISSKHIDMGSSFEDLVATSPTVKTDLKSYRWHSISPPSLSLPVLLRVSRASPAPLSPRSGGPAVRRWCERGGRASSVDSRFRFPCCCVPMCRLGFMPLGFLSSEILSCSWRSAEVVVWFVKLQWLEMAGGGAALATLLIKLARWA